MNNNLPLYKDDYIVSWDISDKDHPCITLLKLGREKDGTLGYEYIGSTFARSGSFSLRQALEEHDREKRRQEERNNSAQEFLRKTFQTSQDNKELTKDQQGLYNKTVERLARSGAKSQKAQILSLAEEIERYRAKIKQMEGETDATD